MPCSVPRGRHLSPVPVKLPVIGLELKQLPSLTHRTGIMYRIGRGEVEFDDQWIKSPLRYHCATGPSESRLADVASFILVTQPEVHTRSSAKCPKSLPRRPSRQQ